jgi:hypothetical protein
MASGTGGQVALIKVNSIGDQVNSANLWTNFVSESMEHTLEELEEGSITGRRDAPPSHKGIDFGGGDIVMEPNPNAIGVFLNAAVGAGVSSLITDAGSTGANSTTEAGKPYFYHNFIPRQTAFGPQSFLEPYGIMVYRDVGSAFMFDGSILTGLEFDIQAGQLVGATATAMTRTVRRIERIAAINSLVSSGGRPFVWDMASVEISTDATSANLAANTNFEQLTLSLETPHEGVVLLDGTKNYAEFQQNEFRRMNISGTISFANHDEYEAFIAYEARRMRVSIQNVNSALTLGNIASLDANALLGYYGMRFHIPQMKFLSWSTPIGGPNRLQTSFTAKAEFESTIGEMFRIELFNVTSGYEN